MYVKDIIDNVKAIRDETNKPDKHERTRSILTGSIVGGITFLMIGYSRKWNLFFSAIGGAVIGGGIAAVFTPKK